MSSQQDHQSSPGRLASLDGLRGIAAFLVIVFHFLSAYYYSLVPDQTRTPRAIADTPLAILYNGPFCVIIFFVLSGFVVSQSAAKNRDSLPINLGLRYLRLALPATASVLFAWVLLRWDPNALPKLYAVIPHEWLTGSYGGNIPPLSRAIRSGLFEIFVFGGSFWNNVLWTMKPELLGSCSLYVIFRFTKGRLRVGILTFLAVLLFAINRATYEGFMLGGLLSELRSAGKLPTRFPVIAFLVGILLGFEGRGFSNRMNMGSVPDLLKLGEKTSVWYAVGATLIVYGSLASPGIRAALSARVFQFLGRISFALYLCHVPLLYTVFASLYLAVMPVTRWKGAGIFLLFLVVSLFVGYLGTIAVDEPVLRLTKRLRERSRGRRPAIQSPR